MKKLPNSEINRRQLQLHDAYTYANSNRHLLNSWEKTSTVETVTWNFMTLPFRLVWWACPMALWLIEQLAQVFWALGYYLVPVLVVAALVKYLMGGA